MFDPTAYENMKVVLEGAIYDRDLHGEISIIDRNDVVNTAKLSRSYELTFFQNLSAAVQCQIKLEAGLENLAAELLPQGQERKLAGAALSVLFRFKHKETEGLHEMIDKELEGIWGEDRSFDQKVSYHPLEQEELMTTEITIHFNRLIFEEQIDDLIEMMDYCLETIQVLQPFSK